jgi:hypothetical protein
MVPQTVDPAISQAVAATSGAAALFGAAQEWALALFGVPLPAVFGAFAGTCYGVTFGEPKKWYVLVGSVIMTTALASLLAPLGVSYVGGSAVATVGAAAIAGFALQFGGPWLAANRVRILDGIRDKFLGGPK